MRLLALASVGLLVAAVAGCSSADQTVSDRLSLAPEAPPPSINLGFVPGAAAHHDAYMDPYDPADQQQNQGHGLAIGPNDPEYFAEFLRF